MGVGSADASALSGEVSARLAGEGSDNEAKEIKKVRNRKYGRTPIPVGTEMFKVRSERCVLVE
jgi:hypothetical protein